MTDDLFDKIPDDTPKDRGSDKRRKYIPHETYVYLTEKRIKPGSEDFHGNRYGEWDPEK
jgi:hypothetical protein